MTFFEALKALPEQFSPDNLPREHLWGAQITRPRKKLLDPLGGFLLELSWNQTHHPSGPLDLDWKAVQRHSRECDHYVSNICVLLWYFDEYLRRARRAAPARRGPLAGCPQVIRRQLVRIMPEANLIRLDHRLRYLLAPLVPNSIREGYQLDFESALLALNIEKLLTDIRSYLDSFWKMTVAIAPKEVRKPLSNSLSESYGKFADRYEKGKLLDLQFPLSTLTDPVPWAQTVRCLRDNYIHNGKASIAMPRFGHQGDAQVYFSLHAFGRGPERRDLPDLLYARDSPNDLLDLELFVLYAALPVFASRHVLGSELRDHYRTAVAGWKVLTDGTSTSGAGVTALCAMLRRHPRITREEIYRFRR